MQIPPVSAQTSAFAKSDNGARAAFPGSKMSPKTAANFPLVGITREASSASGPMPIPRQKFPSSIGSGLAAKHNPVAISCPAILSTTRKRDSRLPHYCCEKWTARKKNRSSHQGSPRAPPHKRVPQTWVFVRIIVSPPAERRGVSEGVPPYLAFLSACHHRRNKVPFRCR